MRRAICGLLAVGILLAFCSCQSDFSRPADYTFDAEHIAWEYTLDLSGLELPGTSKTFAFEVKNSDDAEKEYTVTALILGELPLVCEFTSEAGNKDGNILSGSNIVGRIAKGETHRYTLTVAWPAAENSYIYAGGTASVTVEAMAK